MSIHISDTFNNRMSWRGGEVQCMMVSGCSVKGTTYYKDKVKVASMNIVNKEFK